MMRAVPVALSTPESVDAVASAASRARFAHTAYRYNSWSAGGRRAFLGTAVVATMTMVAYSVVFGGTPIVGFAVLELVLLYGTLAYVEIHADDYERVTLDERTLCIETLDAGRITVRHFNRHWIRVTYDAAARRVTLHSHGDELQLGRHLCPHDRQAWHAELVRILS
jgi:uncharacterized membrane protein